MAQRLIPALQQTITPLGEVATGYKLKTYATLTSTPLATYSNEGLTIANANPATGATTGNQIVNADGYFGDLWVNSPSNYKMILTDENDVVIETPDPVDGSASSSLTMFNPMPAAFWGTTSGTSSAYILSSSVDISGIGYSSSQTFLLAFNITCIANPTLAIDGLSALNLKKYTGQGSKVSLLAGDITNETYLARNDGTDIIILNPRSSPLYFGAATTITIASGIITLTNSGSNYLFDTEGSAATDDLDTINPGVDGEKIFIGNVADARNVIIKHNTGNIFNPVGIDVALDVTSNKIEMVYSAALSKWIITSNFSLAPVLNIQDQKASGTSGGVPSSNFNTRVLNTVVKNTISGASLASNIITLPAGSYKVWATAPAYAAGPQQLFLYNSSDSTTILFGSSQSMAGAGNANSEHSTVFGIFTLAVSKNIILRHWIRDAVADGFGAAVNTGLNEVYAQILIEKIG